MTEADYTAKFYNTAVTIELSTYKRVRGTGKVVLTTKTVTGVGHRDEARDRWVIYYAGPRGAIYETIHTDPRRVWVCRSLTLSAKPMWLDRAAIRFNDFRPATDADRKAVFGDKG